jgi:hypothetical protein
MVFVLFLSLLSLSSFAFQLTTKVSEIEFFAPGYDHSLVFLSTGLVAKVPSAKSELLLQLQSAHKEQSLLFVTMNDDREITSIKVLENSEDSLSEEEKGFSASLVPNDTPTLLRSSKEAWDLFRYARSKHKESQCYNRAHIWSYEWQTDKNINTAKMFLFFSVKYIRENNFHWWFHVAPYAHVAIGTEIKERILDKKFMPGPSTLRSWIDRFMEDGTRCRTIKAYSEYANYPESGLCYIMRTNMYTYRPLDLELSELKGMTKTYWVPTELHLAYEEAFDIIIGGK